MRLSDGTDLTGRTRFVAKDCMLFEETPGAPLVTVSLEHVVTIRLSG
ncbi:MAG TPA: hypothetical protein VGL59_15960 [Polyangia bacterium]